MMPGDETDVPPSVLVALDPPHPAMIDATISS
jgi:hypothetical protein